LLSAMLPSPEPLIEKLEFLISSNPVVVIAPGPSLESLMPIVKPVLHSLQDRLTLIAVDGALTSLVENNLTSHILVTDLDGVEPEFLVDDSNEIIVLHAHGDNIDRIKRYPQSLFSKTVGTCQVDFNNRILNIGGFTDGDRAVCLCELFNARTVFLLGMDFGFKIGRFSKPHLKINVKTDSTKRLKLVYAMNIIEELIFNSKVKYYCLLHNSELEHIPVIGLVEFQKLMR
ncbi:MAG: 6-hydroxymethylpterin diphosphokinase MptE-like protein, partial [Nitrososphaerota archaeon]